MAPFRQPDAFPPGTSYIESGSFERPQHTPGKPPMGWGILNTPSQGLFTVDDSTAHEGECCLRISVPADGNVGFPYGATLRVNGPTTRQKLILSAWVKTEGLTDPVGVGICVQGRDKENVMTAFFTSQTANGLVRPDEWTEILAEGAVPEPITYLLVMPFVTGPGTAWFDDITLTEAGPATDEEIASVVHRPRTRSDRPMLTLARTRFELRAIADVGACTVYCPLPLDFEDQAPLGLRLAADPPECLQGWSLQERLPDNWVAALRIADMPRGQSVGITMECPVLLRAHDYSTLPETIPYPDPATIPDDVRPWLASTRSVQSAHKEIARRAAELRAKSPDLMAFARNVAPVPHQAPAGKPVAQLDAVTALDAQGSCTSNANLVAALFRAAGVPARVLSGYPTWVGPLQTHYIVEFWAGEQGWVWLESSMGDVPCPSPYQVQVSIVYPDDEDRSFRDFASDESYCATVTARGVPWMSLTEGGPREGLTWAGLLDPGHHADHEALVLAEFAPDDPDLEAAFAAARGLWQACRPTLAEGASIPQIDALIDEVQEAKSPTDLLALIEEARSEL